MIQGVEKNMKLIDYQIKAGEKCDESGHRVLR